VLWAVTVRRGRSPPRARAGGWRPDDPRFSHTPLSLPLPQTRTCPPPPTPPPCAPWRPPSSAATFVAPRKPGGHLPRRRRAAGPGWASPV